MAKCAGECKIQFTKILGTGSNTDGTIVPELPPGADKWSKDQRKEVAGKYIEAVQNWAEPVPLKPACEGEKCICHRKEPTPEEWKKEPELKREFIVHVPIAGGTQTYEVKADISFKVKVVASFCVEPPDKPIELPVVRK